MQHQFTDCWFSVDTRARLCSLILPQFHQHSHCNLLACDREHACSACHGSPHEKFWESIKETARQSLLPIITVWLCVRAKANEFIKNELFHSQYSAIDQLTSALSGNFVCVLYLLHLVRRYRKQFFPLFPTWTLRHANEQWLYWIELERFFASSQTW